MQMQDLDAIWSAYLKVDSDHVGYVTQDQLLTFISETQYSIAAPYFTRFFELIDKEHLERATFEELACALAVFCLYTREELISFVFCMFDEDCDGIISKLDIFRFLLQFR